MSLMWSRNKYCAVCGCSFGVPDIRDPVNPDPDEDPSILLGDPYDARLLAREQTQWLTEFRVVGRWSLIEPSMLNESSIPDLFVSPPAAWFYGYGRGEPEIPTTKGSTKDPGVYVALDHDDDMVFPIHKACLQILERLCQTRQMQAHASKTEKPASLLDFCDGLRKQRWSNDEEAGNPFSTDRYYARSGGLEWPHDYYGARQFWTDEWDEEPGWEHLCADPSPFKVPDLTSYLINEIRVCSSAVKVDMPTSKQLADRLGWLLPEELDTVMDTKLDCIDWDKLVDTLLRKASEDSHTVGDEEERKEGKLKPTTAPVGLQNRWRIWKILEAI